MVNETIKLYNYQKDATNFVLDNIDETHVLLAAAPNAGKTFMASFIIKELIKNGSRVLCSVHGTNVLKRQFYDSICNIVGIESVSIYDTSDLSLYNPQKPVQVMIYQNTKQMEECVEEYGGFDYLVVDEAHKFYDGTDSMETIGAEFVSGNHLLLTGSPAIFKERVDSGEIRAKYISASLIESVHDGQYDKEIRLDVVSNDVHLTIDDYNQNGEVTEKSQNKLVNNEPVLDSLLVDDFGKTIIFVKRTRQADIIETYLNNRGIINYTSHSKSDKDSENIDEFKNNYTGVDNVVLIVVGRATEGFDDPNVSIIDMTYSKNIDTLYQRYSRAIRKRTDAKDKRYVKVVPNNGNSAEVFIHIMTAVLMLLKQEHYENFNGKNFSIPTLKQEVKKPASGVGAVRSYLPKPKHETNDITDSSIVIKSKEKPQSVKDLVDNSNFVVNVTVDDNVYEIKSEDYNEWANKLEGKEYTITIEKSNDRVDDCLLMETRMYSGSFFNTKDELYGYITRYATSSLQDVLRVITSNFLSPEEHFNICVKHELITITKYEEFKNLNNEINLHSAPHTLEGILVSEYFNRVKKSLGIEINWLTYDETIEICVINNVIEKRNYKQFKDNNLNFKLHSRPWVLNNKKESDFFYEVKERLGLNTKMLSIDETIEICVSNNLINGILYRNYVNTFNNGVVRMYTTPWVKLGIKSLDFFKIIKERIGIVEFNVKNIDECIKLAKKHGINSSRGWSIGYKKICKVEEIKLPSAPWLTFKLDGGSKEFSKLLGNNHYDYDVKTIMECVMLGKKHGIITAHKWANHGYKIINELDKIKVPAAPWLTFKLDGGEKEFTRLLKESISYREYRPAYLGEFSELNKKWNTSNSKTTHQKLKKDKTEWVKYHELYSNARKNWDEIPYVEIGKIIKNRPEWVVGDFGCGENLLSKEITNKVHAFDHVAIDENVTSCDLTNVPLNDGVLDVVVFSLSLMGTNYKEYFKEAYRTLKPMGLVIIAEPSNRWEDRDDEMKELLEEVGFKINGDIKHTERFIYVTAIKM